MKARTSLERAIAAVISLRFTPADLGVRRVIAEILIETCNSDQRLDIATRVITREMTEWPGPAEFRRLIGAAVKAAVTLPVGCPRCSGVDFVIVEANGASVGRRCACERGKALAIIDAKRKTGGGTASGKDCSTTGFSKAERN